MGDASGPFGFFPVLEKGKHKEGGGVNVLAFASELQSVRNKTQDFSF